MDWLLAMPGGRDQADHHAGSYSESTDDSNLDNKLILKIATGTKGNLEAIPAEELVPITAYINKLKFAGTRIEVISTKVMIGSPADSIL